MSPIAVLLSLFVSQSLWAATFEVPVKEGDRVVLKGLDAQIQLVSQPGSSLKISGMEESKTEGAYTLEKKGSVIEITMTDFSGKRNWLSGLSKASSYMKKIEIMGPSVPVEIYLRAGSVSSQRWMKEVKTSITQGKFNSLGGKGSLDVSVQRGDVNIQEHNGKVKADVYSGNIALKEITGDVEASIFTGALGAEKLKGFVDVTSQAASSKINQSSGTLQFENGKGGLVVQGFQGRIEGQNAEGNVNITMNLDSEVDVRAKSGKIAIQAAPNSGASVNLFTVDGEISVPKELRVVKLSAEKSVRGKLRGDAARGNIFVRGQDTSILVK